MKRVMFVALAAVGLTAGIAHASTRLQWVRAKLPVGRVCPETCFEQADREFAKRLVSLTTVQVEPKLKWIKLDGLEELVKYPFLFFHVDWEIDLPDAMIKNIREYLARGGFIFAEDCLDCSAKNDPNYRGLLKVWEGKIFPGMKMVKLPKTHPIYQQPFDLTRTAPKMMAEIGGSGYYDEKGRLVAYLSAFGVNCHWDVQKDVEDLYKLRINVISYVLTH